MSKHKKAPTWMKSRPSAPAAAAATGPRTPEGKAVSSQNSRVHGLTGDHIVLPHEDAAAYECLLSGLMRTYRPEGECEKLLVRHAAESQWLLLRAARLEAAMMTLIAAGEDAKPSTPDQRIAAYMLSKPGDAIAKVQRYRTSAERSFYRAIKELRAFIAARSEEPQFVSQNSAVGQVANLRRVANPPAAEPCLTPSPDPCPSSSSIAQ